MFIAKSCSSEELETIKSNAEQNSAYMCSHKNSYISKVSYSMSYDSSILFMLAVAIASRSSEHIACRFTAMRCVSSWWITSSWTRRSSFLFLRCDAYILSWLFFVSPGCIAALNFPAMAKLSHVLCANRNSSTTGRSPGVQWVDSSMRVSQIVKTPADRFVSVPDYLLRWIVH